MRGTPCAIAAFLQLVAVSVVGAQVANQPEQDCATQSRITVERKMAACREVIAKKPNDPAAYRHLGDLYFSVSDAPLTANDINLFIVSYSNAIALTPQLGPQEAVLLVRRGIVYVRGQKQAEALSDFNKAIELDPKFAPAYEQRASLLRRKFDFAGALADYDRLVDLQPTKWIYLFDRSQVRTELGQYKDAIADYEKQLSITPNDRSAKEEIAALKKLMERPDPAAECAAGRSYQRGLKACDEVIEKDLDNAEAYFSRAKIRLKRSEFAAAFADLDRATDLNPKEPRYREQLYHIYRLQKNNKGALYALTFLMQSSPNSAQYHAWRAEILNEQGDFKQSIADWDRAIKLDAKRASYLCGRAKAFAASGDKTRAAADVAAAVKSSGERGYCE